jgi:hypothetical protein
MARKSKMSVLKRQRELKKAEKAELKREEMRARRERTSEAGSADAQVATREDLEIYGIVSPRGRDA